MAVQGGVPSGVGLRGIPVVSGGITLVDLNLITIARIVMIY